MKKIITFILILCMACSLCGCLEDTDPKTTIGDNTVSTTDSNEDNSLPIVDSNESGSSDEPKKDDQMATVGQNVSGHKWKLSLLSAKMYGTLKGYISDEVEAGKKFLVLSFEVENISGEDDRFNCFYFESYIDGYAGELIRLHNVPDDLKILSGDVASGKKMKGYICYEVPEDWKEIEVHYKERLSSTEIVKLKFIVTPDKVS